MQTIEQIQETKEYILAQLHEAPEIGLILGSGLGVLADEIENPIAIPYHEIPHFPTSTVEGHKGQLVIGQLNGKLVVAMQGRFHYYEGYSLDTVTFPVRVMAAIGVQKILVTNAAGGINTSFEPGELMLIEDHINMTGRNPLIGPHDSRLGVRFPDMSEAYSKELVQLAEQVAKEQGIEVKKGIYAGLTGPSYETPAEIRMLRMLGADAVGMSTVPEVIVARHSGMKVLGISCISNMAAGILPQPLTHEEVMETAEKAKEKFLGLVKGIVKEL
ncbi:purine-nucleoside phosphorylase [Ammoniphilus sp. CFH 90114]|uniref:purine-nucleoside phosphorylase n=1 Tax=Ammoniphilus sp. CFH 90114 TaxID=2493665 RepID=UPI00100DEF1E|nr:purine-nucleoside phosphorylase [Ammoniphilus sp. CFH 90114]RXT13831.1 purine-nucleoside phosphorylase [Ammoniphilus sp. CFH 90114]